MSAEHDELFQLMLGRTTTKAVERILAAGYRKPQEVTTEVELDALPNGSVIRDSWDVLVKGGNHWRYGDVATEVQLPATVLHVGGAE